MSAAPAASIRKAIPLHCALVCAPPTDFLEFLHKVAEVYAVELQAWARFVLASKVLCQSPYNRINPTLYY